MGCGPSKPRYDKKMDSIHDSIKIKNDNFFDKISLRIVLSGAKFTGKTQFFKTYNNNPDDPYTSEDMNTNYDNIDKNVINKMVILKEGRVNLALWDLAGDKKDDVKNLTRNFFRESNGVFVLFDLTKPETFEKIKTEWLPFIDDTLGFNSVQSIYNIIFLYEIRFEFIFFLINKILNQLY